MRHFFLFLMCLIFSFGCKVGVQKQASDITNISVTNHNQIQLDQLKNVRTIAFGSCNHEDDPQPLWSDIASDDPDLWIWLGDSIYGDSEDPNVLRSKYNLQKNTPEYSRFIHDVPVIGIWDDHDYGVNNGDSTYPIKKESRDAFYDFLDIPTDSPLRKREGAYQSYTFDEGDKTIKVLLLDTRYFKDPIERKNRKYILNPENDILGDAQWNWLESEMKGEQDLLIIANGTQVIPEEHPYEKWANYPSSRERLMDMCSTAKGQIVLLSGDRHFGEISRMSTYNYRSLYEVTSSGMTHTYEELEDEPNRHRYGKFTTQLNYGIIQISDESVKLQLKGQSGVVRNELVIPL